MKRPYRVLVPHDFTSVADNALSHAVKFAGLFKGGQVYLLHVVKDAEEVNEAEEKLTAIANAATAKYNVEINPLVRIGNIFDDIPHVAEEMHFRLVVMGTHGMKGMQHVTGSWALKVITNTPVPFIVVQDKSVSEDFKTFVVPVDFENETKLKLKMLASMAKHTRAEVHLYVKKVNDRFLKEQTQNNLTFTKRFLEENEIPFQVAESEEAGNYVKQLVHYSVSIDADLMVIVNLDYQNFIKVLGQKEEQQVITNEAQIPVMVVNPNKDFIENAQLFNHAGLN